jgi:hypothetical protein
LGQGIINPYVAPCVSPIALVPKKDGTWKMCANFREINKITIENRYPLPRIEDFLNQL